MSPYKKLNIKIRQLIDRYEKGELTVSEYETGLKALYQEHLAIEGESLEDNEKDILETLIAAI